MKITTAVRTAMCQALVDLIDVGASASTIQIRTGSQPSSPNSAATGSLLATITLDDPAFATASGGSADANPIDPVAGTGDGTAGYFRVLDGNGATIEDGSVSVTGGGGDMQLNTTTISTGVDVLVTSWTITVPEG